MLWRWNTLKLELLFDAWESRDVMEFSLNATFYQLKYRVKVVSLRAKTLVTYIYKSISNGNVSTPENPEKINQLLELGEKLKGQVVGDFQVESVSIRSIDSCLKEVRSNSSVNESLSLPDTLWNCPLEQETGTLITSTESTKGNNGTCLWGTTTVSNNGNYTTKNPESPITRQLHDLSQSFEERDVPKVAEELRNLTSEVQPEEAVEKDVILIADTLQEITTISKKLPQSTVQHLLDTVSKVSRFPERSLGGTQNGSGATTRILHTIDKLGALLQIEEDQSHKRIVSEGFGLEVWDIDKQSPDEDIVIGIKVLAEGDKKLNESEKLVTQFSNTIVDNSDTEAAIYLPKEILKHYTGREGSPKVRLVMNVYRDTSLYENSASDSEEVEGVNITLNSRVIAAQLLVNGQQITNLTDHKVQIVFKPKESKGRSQCAFWDFSANLTQGHWNTSGCKYRDRVDGRDVCECDHLTNFAVLVSFKSQSTLEHTEALGYITLIGLILSIFGLTISILSFLCIKKLRQGRPQQTMFQLSVALLLSWVVFLAGVNRTSDHTGCVVVAALLHYLILASFMWMLMEAVVQFLLFVRVMNPHISHYMWKMGLPSWGVPVIPVVITLSIDPDLYIGGPKYCWMSRQVFYYGFALPVGIIISANLVIFCLICASLFRRKDMSKHSSMKANQTMVNLRACFISFCMLGLTWIFGFLAIEHARLGFQILFCMTSSLQGFFIFLMITARDRQVRRFWLDNVCCCMKRWVKSESSSGVTPSTTTAAARARKPKLMDRILSRELKRGQTPPTSTTSTGITMASDNQYESFL
ncbi:hypothetical protein RRG08_061509 [Elysia crispata]|uniref:Uncharacterized protein n=1 Tax=Elysia crispata TaxID=231223 RepID=A0AAE0XVU8_9GAST|nr:hypothetical protein RRG08_061509 [Elysia crispata]